MRRANEHLLQAIASANEAVAARGTDSSQDSITDMIERARHLLMLAYSHSDGSDPDLAVEFLALESELHEKKAAGAA